MILKSEYLPTYLHNNSTSDRKCYDYTDYSVFLFAGYPLDYIKRFLFVNDKYFKDFLIDIIKNSDYGYKELLP